ncbi:MAG: Uma2 family endonuclease [Thermoleophilaceae bacterium]|nr:Uma2 family endonuclease [Thermoleophilaceae bacterium]
MTAMPVAQPMIAQEFLALPVPERGRPWNLIDGEVVVNEPTPLHMAVQFDLAYALRQWADARAGRGWVCLSLDVRLDERNVYAPDILWYAQDRAPGKHAKPPSPMPDLAVEVRSPSTWRYDIGAKKSGYEREGLPELWLVDTAAGEVLVFRRSTADARSFDIALELGANDALGSPLLPGFTLALSEPFGDQG